MNRFIAVIILFNINVSLLHSQTENLKKPKLIVGIVVDQMRFDQLYRYEEKYSDDGFKRIMKEGFNYKNAHFNFTPTVTASGHASIYTGTTPSMHGIIGNSWFDRHKNQDVRNVKDTSETIIGSKEQNQTGISPKMLLSSTISDQLRLSNNFKSKVISISLKDRGAVLPGGHTANAAYWYDWQSSPGYFVSSSYYMNELPDWVVKFNKQGSSNQYLDTVWNTLYPIENYNESIADNNSYERTLRGKTNPIFPYDFKAFRKIYKDLNAEYQLLWVSPAGDKLLTEFAMETIKNENLGADEVTDMLTISYSVPDVAGHTFGLQSIEIEDIYLRLDIEIGNLLKFLDEMVGIGDYILFLTSDHGAISVASYLNDFNIPTGIARIERYKDNLISYLNTKLGEDSWIQSFDGDQVYLNRTAISKRGLQLQSIQQDVANFLVNLDGIKSALTAHQLQTNEYNNGLRNLLQNGYHQKRSGDVLFVFDPGVIQTRNSDINISSVKGSTHGSGYAYDTHVPLLWFGFGIPRGTSIRKVSITDISSTLAMMLNLQLPSGNTGCPLKEIFI
jgi:predicted AlkP superfamily pyrophosphatase or phosphodiesterase